MSRICTSYSLEGDMGISLGVVGLTYDTNIEKNGVCVYVQAPTFMYQSINGIGLDFSPLVYRHSFKNKDNSILTFANASLYYNIFRNKECIFGPFVSASALKLYQPDYFEAQAGLIFSFRIFGDWSDYLYSQYNSIFVPELLLVKTGYKYNRENKHGFFATIAIEGVGLLYVLLSFFG